MSFLMAISGDLIQKLLPLLRPLMEDKEQRRAYLILALGADNEVLHRLVLNTATDVFIPNLVQELDSFGDICSGKPALYVLLEVIRERVGEDVQLRIDKLLKELQNSQNPNPYSQSPKSLVFDMLLQIDFKQQSGLVRKAINLHKTAAFLVHGEPFCGQQSLVTRLFRLKPEWKNISPIKIDVSCNGVGKSIPYLWRQLAPWFHLPKNVEPEKIIEKICDRLSTQNVVFIFYTVDYMPSNVLIEWLQEFWKSLISRVEDSCPSNPLNKHLLMFLVDNSGSVCQSNIHLATEFDEPNFPGTPLQLPPVNQFCPDVLDEWIDMVIAIDSIQIPTDLTSQVLFEESENGLPEFVYEKICKHLGLSWEGDLAQWLI